MTLILLFQLLINVPGASNGCSGNGGIFNVTFFTFFTLVGDLNLCPLAASFRLFILESASSCSDSISSVSESSMAIFNFCLALIKSSKTYRYSHLTS